MHPSTHLAGRRALRASALAGISVVAALGFAPAANAAYTAHVSDGTLQITGDRASDKLALQPDPADANTLLVDVGEDGTTDFAFDRSTFTAIDIHARGGDDDVRVSNGLADEALTVDGGAGNDTITGGDGADVLIGGAGNDVVTGGRGNDTVELGGGADTFVWNPGDGSDTVDGQDGNDTMQFNGANVAENVNVTANGSRVRFTRDVAAITMDLGGIENVNFAARGAADTVTVGDLAGTGVKSTNVDLGGADGAADTVIAQGTPYADNVSVASADGTDTVSGLHAKVRVSGGESADTLDVATLGGDDKLAANVGLAGPLAVDFDGGEGTDTTTYTGSGAADDIGLAANNGGVVAFTPTSAPVTSEVEDLLVRGLGGADAITGSNGIATLTHLTVDGGDGDDTIRGGDGADVLIGGDGNDTVFGGRGNDAARLGAGNDRFVWDPGDASDTVDGQSGSDVLQFDGANVAERISLSASGSHTRLVRDVAAITMDLSSIEDTAVNALGGADVLTVDNLAGTGIKAVDLNLAGQGGAGDGAADTVIVNGTPGADHVSVTRSGSQVLTTGLAAETRITGSEPGLDGLQVNTLGGRDAVTVAPDVNTLIDPSVDLGADQ